MTRVSREALLLQMYEELRRMIRALAHQRRWPETIIEDVIQETFCRLAEFMRRRTFSRRTWRWQYRNALRDSIILVMNLHENSSNPGPRHQVREIPTGLANS